MTVDQLLWCIMLLCFPSGKVLIIGGGIANFTNVAATFKVNFNTLRFYFQVEI